MGLLLSQCSPKMINSIQIRMKNCTDHNDCNTSKLTVSQRLGVSGASGKDQQSHLSKSEVFLFDSLSLCSSCSSRNEISLFKEYAQEQHILRCRCFILSNSETRKTEVTSPLCCSRQGSLSTF